MTEAVSRVEMAILGFFHSIQGFAPLDGLMLLISRLGNAGVIFIVMSLALLCVPRTRRLGGVCATALALDALLVNLMIKPFVARARPFTDGAFELLLPAPSDFSFPSGHTAAAFAFAFALAPAGKKWQGAAIAFACAMGLSRLYLMVHFPTDVLFGALFGALCGKAALFLWKKAGKRDIL